MNTTQSRVYNRPSPGLRGATRRGKMWEYVLSAIIGWNVNSVKWNDEMEPWNGAWHWTGPLVCHAHKFLGMYIGSPSIQLGSG